VGTGNCEIDVDECASSPCQNGATCYEDVSDWSCQCATVDNPEIGDVLGWEGEFCEIVRDLCELDEDDCDPNNAQCTHDGPGLHTCTCNIGWEGDGTTCADIDECESSPCQNGGVCTQSDCLVSSHTTGGYPNGIGISDDVAATCSNPSIPVDFYSCACADGYADGLCADGWDTYDALAEQYATTCTVVTGGTCSIDIDECASAPCVNGAGCAESAGTTATGASISAATFSCACVDGFASGVCTYDFISEYSAACAVAEDGICDVDVDECASSPCANDAACTDSTDGGGIEHHAYS
jgi:hypothetical protein